MSKIKIFLITLSILIIGIGILYYNYPMYFVPDINFYLYPDSCTWGGE